MSVTLRTEVLRDHKRWPDTAQKADGGDPGQYSSGDHTQPVLMSWGRNSHTWIPVRPGGLWDPPLKSRAERLEEGKGIPSASPGENHSPTAAGILAEPRPTQGLDVYPEGQPRGQVSVPRKQASAVHTSAYK